jgi:sugar phosphate permease
MGTYVKNWFPQQERGRANACWTIGMTLAPAIALPFFGWLIITFGWRYNFFFCALLSMVPLYLILTHTTDVPSQNQHVNKEELEYIQAGMEEDTIQADVAAKEPYLTRLKKFSHNYRFWMMVVWYMGIQIILWGLVTWLPSYLKMGRGFSWTEMGFLASMPFVLGIFVKAATGWAIDVVHKSGIFCLLATVGAALGLYFSATIENNWISAVLIICSQGFMYMGSPASFTLLQKLVPAGSMATATGLMIGLSMFAGAVSPMLIGYFINFTGSYSGGIFFLGIAAVISTVAMLPLAKQ